jgi:hypothetical protein
MNKYLHSKSRAEVNMKPTDSPFVEGSHEGKRGFLVGVRSQSAMATKLDFGKILG